MIRRSSLLVAAAVAVVLLGSAAAAAPAPAAQPPAHLGAAQLVDSAHANVDLRWLGGVGALVLGGLLLLLYVYRRRLYILEWTVGWLFLAAALFLAARDSPSAHVHALAVGLSQFLSVCSGLTFVVSVDSFRQRARIHRGYLLALLPLFIWFMLAPLALGTWPVLVPGFLIAAGALATAGVGYLSLLRRTRLLGAGLVGLTFILVAASNVWFTASASRLSAGFSVQVFALTALLYIFAGLGMHLMVFEDMTYELRRTNRRLESAQGELRRLVITDGLTGSYNRRHFEEVIAREIERHERYRLPLSLVFVDIDRFKAVNDSLGHEAGDQVLKYVADFLTKHVRRPDSVFRWGGDEFLILISCDEEAAERKGLELQQQFAASAQAARLPPGLGLSVGCVEMPADEHDVMELVKTADARMYRDKARTRPRRTRSFPAPAPEPAAAPRRRSRS